MIGHQDLDEAKMRLGSSSSDLLQDLALRVLRLNPDRQNPEGFLIAKDEIACEMRRVARRLGAAQ